MKFWIASYPRSGNTFLRILFKEVYGIHTWEGYGNQTPQNVLNGLANKFPNKHVLIKTHELPEHTQIPHQQLKAIYLVRDGRDAVVSLAYHRKQIVKPNSNLKYNLLTNILAPLGTSFGGWSTHVNQWRKCADIVIKFEELIADPKKQLLRLEKLMGLPKGDYTKIPTFQDLKTKKYSFGSGKNTLSSKDQQKMREKFFRSGKSNTWTKELTKTQQDIFIYKHGKILKEMGYIEKTLPSKWISLQLIKYYFLWLIGYIKERFN